jgi:hypothetical protein
MNRATFFLLVFIQALAKKTDSSIPIDYAESLIKYCAGKSQLDFCSREQIEFGLLFLMEYQRKIQQDIKLERQEFLQKQKQSEVMMRRKQKEEFKQQQLNHKLREHFLDRHM